MKDGTALIILAAGHTQDALGVITCRMRRPSQQVFILYAHAKS